MNIPMTGVPACDEMLDFQMIGNIVPHSWFQTIIKTNLKNPKPHLLAILVLADVAYWYRPTAKLDESTGNLVGYAKKFHGDLLQRNYSQIAEHYGCSRGQAKEAADFLQNLGVITRVFRDIEVNGNIYNNQMYIGLNVARLRELTYPTSEISEEGEGIFEGDDVEIWGEEAGNYEGDTSELSVEGVEKNAVPPANNPKYTKITTETSSEISDEIPSLTPSTSGATEGVSEERLKDMVMNRLKQANKLPTAYCNNLLAMTIAIKHLTESDFREKNGFSLLKDEHEESMMATHRLMVSCLVDMCSTPGAQHYRKGNATRELVVEKINHILALDHGFLSGFAEVFCTAFLEELAQRQINDTYGYMKAMLWDYLQFYPTMQSNL